jgi:hypothetical protein
MELIMSSKDPSIIRRIDNNIKHTPYYKTTNHKQKRLQI